MTVQTSSAFGGLLRHHRLAAGLTQEELAEAAGVSARSISDLERGLQRNPYPGTIRRLADALGLDAANRGAFLDAAVKAPAPAAELESRDATVRRPEVSRSSRWISRGFTYSRWWPVIALAAAIVIAAAALTLVRYLAAHGGTQFGTVVRSLAVPGVSTVGRPTSVAVASDGTLYVLDRAAATVRVYDRTGRLLTVWGGPGSQPGRMWEPGGLALGPAHQVYVADTGNGRIQEFSHSGRLRAVWADQYGAPGTFRPDSIAVDQSGIVYAADADHYRVLRLDSSGHMLDTLPPPSVSFSLPIPVFSSVSIGPTGWIYVADGQNDMLMVYEPGGVPTPTLIHTSGHPVSVAADRRGNIYLTYRGSAVVQELSPIGARLHTWRADGLRTPQGIVLGSDGTLYLADPGSGVVSRLTGRRWVPVIRSGPQAGVTGTAVRIAAGPRGSIAVAAAAGGRITWLHHTPNQPPTIDLGRLLRSRFVGPIGGLAVAADGTMYVTDSGSGRVLELTPDGQFARSWGASPPPLTHPQGVSIDRAGNVYVADEGNGRVQEFSSDGRLLNLVPVPQPVSAGLIGPAPNGVAVDGSGSLYITDEIYDHVLKLDPTNRVRFQWGAHGSGPSGLRAPQGIALDEKRGRIYVVDNGNNRIQVLTTDGRLLGAIRVDRPQDVAVDSVSGRVYVLDGGGSRVQIFTP